MVKLVQIKIPGPGAKGTGTVAIKNYDAWQKIEVKMDTLAENKEIDTTFEMFGKTFKYPIFAGPVGAVSQHYSDLYNDNTFNGNLCTCLCKKWDCCFYRGWFK